MSLRRKNKAVLLQQDGRKENPPMWVIRSP